MNPSLQFGSGSPLLGGSSPINEAIARRATGDVGATAQVGGGSPIAQPMPGAMPQGSAIPQGMPPIPGQPLPQGPSDSEIILNALSARLKSDSKIKEAQAIPPTPTPVPTPSPVAGL